MAQRTNCERFTKSLNVSIAVIPIMICKNMNSIANGATKAQSNTVIKWA